MECLVNLLAVCLFDPSAVYLTASVDSKIAGSDNTHPAWCADHWCKGPLGEVRLGARVSLVRSIEMDYGLKHVSSLLERDRGMESVFVSLTWRPFR